MQKLLSREDMMNKKHNFQKCQTHRKHFKGAWVKLGFNPSFEGRMGSYEPQGRIDSIRTPLFNPILPYTTHDLGKDAALPRPQNSAV